MTTSPARRSPLRNRATPLGEIVADPARGLVYGNRGCLHDGAGELRRRYAGRRWISCRLRFAGRRREGLMMPRRYTELFFLDEATALAAGHRPCAECRRADHRAFVTAWQALHPDDVGVEAIDRRLHGERVGPGGARRPWPPVPAAQMPDGAYVIGARDTAWVVCGDMLLRWTPGGYAERTRRPRRTTLEPITPPSLLAVLAGGWRGEAVTFLHPSAADAT